MAQIKTGTVSVTNGSNTVTGSGTKWLTDGVQAGDGFVLQTSSGVTGAGVYYTVAGVASNTSLTLSANWGGDTASGAAYIVHTDFIAAGYPALLPGDLEVKPVMNRNVLKLINDAEDGLSERWISKYTTDELAAASTLKAGDKVRTTGYYAAGDGGGNDFIVEERDGSAEDGGSIIFLDDGVHQARGLFNDGHVWVERFGAHPAISDNRFNVQSAVNYKSNQGGGLVHARVGVFEMSASGGQCILMPSNVGWFCAGKGVTIFKRQAGAEGHVFNGNSVSNITYGRMTVDGNKEAETQGLLAGYHGIRHAGAVDLTLYDVEIKNCIYYGLGLQGSDISKRIRVVDCDIHNNGGWSDAGAAFGDGIDIKGSERVDVINSHAYENAQKGWDIRCNGLKMTNCSGHDNGGDGFNSRGNADFFGKEILLLAELVNCDAFGNGGNGFTVLTNGTLTSRGNVLYSNCSAFGNTGTGYRANDNQSSVSHSNCSAKGNGANGMRYADADDVTVTGGQLMDNGGYGFDNGGTHRRHTIIGVAARNNTSGQIRAAAGADALHANNNSA